MTPLSTTAILPIRLISDADVSVSFTRDGTAQTASASTEYSDGDQWHDQDSNCSGGSSL